MEYKLWGVKTGKFVYKWILPFVILISLLGVASTNNRSKLLGSIVPDLFIRLMICIWFCVIYIKLSEISSFSYFPNKKWVKEDIGKIEKYFLIANCIFICLMGGILTWWAIVWFLPGFSNFAYFISGGNFLILFSPLVTHYWVLKI